MSEEKLSPQVLAVKKYLDDLSEKDECLKTLYVPSKIKDCFKYITEQARKQAVNNCAMVEDSVVYKWARDYYIEVLPGECVLVFVQKNGEPVATAELKKGNKIGQFYANELDRDNCLPTDEVRAVMNKWLEMKEAA